MNDPGTRFAARLLQLLPAERNAVFSPASVRIALAMAAEGARGETERALRDGLGLGDPAAARREIEAQLRRWEALAAAPPRWKGDRAKTKLAVANGLWAQRGGALRREYAVIVRDSYRAKLSALDFASAPDEARATIDSWVRDATEGLIPALIGAGGIRKETKIVLANAVYLKATWERPFRPGWTQDDTFHLAGGGEVKTPFMHQAGDRRHAHVPGGQMLELPYFTGALAMDVIVPAEPGGLPELERAVANDLGTWCAALRDTDVVVALPRWKGAAKLDLADALGRLGMGVAFRYPAADFSGIDGGRELVLSAVLHEARIDVDEEGTEAAAATAAPALAAAAPGGRRREPLVFRADRPFLYLIRDTATGAILFLGRLVDPTAR